MLLVTPEQMREMDRRTIEEIGVPSCVLMDRAARGAVEAILECFCLSPGSSIGVLCGGGNNGGDGLAMASMLAIKGFTLHVVVLQRPDSLSPDSALYFGIAKHHVQTLEVADNEQDLRALLNHLPDCDLWCDALLGTGIDRDVSGRFRQAIEFLQKQDAPIVAVDTPSGLDARTGQLRDIAAPAALTTTFGFAKIGLFLDPARQFCGQIQVIDIGIPPEIRDAQGVDARSLDEPWLRASLPQRRRDLHKGDAGRTLHIGGRPESVGAIALSARAALVGGAGLITVATDRKSQPIIPALVPEVMARGVFDSDKFYLDEPALFALVEANDTVVIGPGLGTDDLAHWIITLVLNAQPRRLIVDADALDLFPSNREIPHLVLTPHPGELSRILSTSVMDLLRDPVAAALELSRRFNATAVFKTAATIVATPAGQVGVNRLGNPGMATGGMGDALTGLIAAAFGDFPEDSFQAAACAVATHALAGDRAARRRGHRGLTVMGLLDEVPALWQELER